MSNHITITGRTGGAPEVTFTKSDMAVAEFRVCSNHGKDEKETQTWFAVKCFGKLAENVANSVGKGDTVIVVGRMETREYTKKDGEKGQFTSVVADEVAVSLRWNAWVKDQTDKVVAKTGKVGRPMPVAEDPF